MYICDHIYTIYTPSLLRVQAEVETKPNLWGNFMVLSGDEVPLYASVPGYDALRTTLTQKLNDYNESNAAMDLVLFQQVSSVTLGEQLPSCPK